MTQLHPYLAFNGNCREAMTFYQSCLGGDLQMQTFGESPMGEQTPAEMKNQILHSALVKDGDVLLFASDGLGADAPAHGHAITLCINCRSEEEITSYFSKLAEGGQASHALKTEFWGATFGELTDKFGMRWMLNYDKNQPA